MSWGGTPPDPGVGTQASSVALGDTPGPRLLPLSGLVRILDLQEIDRAPVPSRDARRSDIFVGKNLREGLYSPRVFGGQLIGQSLVAACRTVDSVLPVHSLHCYFLLPGDPKHDFVFVVQRTRDGRSFATRQVTAQQGGVPVFLMMASCTFCHLLSSILLTRAVQRPEAGFNHSSSTPPDAPPPESLPTTGERWARYGHDPRTPDRMRRAIAQRAAVPFPARADSSSFRFATYTDFSSSIISAGFAPRGPARPAAAGAPLAVPAGVDARPRAAGRRPVAAPLRRRVRLRLRAARNGAPAARQQRAGAAHLAQCAPRLLCGTMSGGAHPSPFPTTQWRRWTTPFSSTSRSARTSGCCASINGCFVCVFSPISQVRVRKLVGRERARLCDGQAVSERPARGVRLSGAMASRFCDFSFNRLVLHIIDFCLVG